MKLHHYLFAIVLAVGLSLTLAGAVRAQSSVQIDTIPAWIDTASRNSTASAWGDLDNDGDLDMVVGTLEQGIYVWTNVDGAFPAVVEVDGVRNQNPAVLHLLDEEVSQIFEGETFADYGNAAVAIGDLNGDDRLDLVVANGRLGFGDEARSHPNQVYLNQTPRGGPITLALAEVVWNTWPANLSHEAPTSDVALADINRDGMLDMAFADRGWVRVYYNATSPGADILVMNMTGHNDACPANPLALKLLDYANFKLTLTEDFLDLLTSLPLLNASETINWIDDRASDDTFAMGPTVEDLFLYDLDDVDDAKVRAIIQLFLIGEFVADEEAARKLSVDELLTRLKGLTLSHALGATGATLRDRHARGDVDDLLGRDLIGYASATEVAKLAEALELFDIVLPFETDHVDFGDLNNDGWPDLTAFSDDFTISPDDYAVQIWTNDHGCYAAPATVQVNGRPSDLVWGDMDNDGYDELAVAYGGAGNEVYANDRGRLADPVWSSFFPDDSVALEWGDVNGDGYLDLAVGNREPSRNAIYLNQPDGEGGRFLVGFSDWEDPLSYEITDVHWGDIDNDGDLDLTSTIYAAPDLVYRNLNPSVAIEAVTVMPDFADRDLLPTDPFVLTANALAWGDVDDDGDLDLALGYAAWIESIGYVPQNIYFDIMQGAPNVVLENVDGALIAKPYWQSTSISPTTSVAWGDMDADRDLDLAVGNQNGTVEFYRNQGAGGLEANPACVLNVRDTPIYARLADDPSIGLIPALRADANLLAFARADNDPLGQLLNILMGDDDSLAPGVTDTDLFVAARSDEVLLARLATTYQELNPDGAELLLAVFSLFPEDDVDMGETLVANFMNDDELLLEALLNDDDLIDLPIPVLINSDLTHLGATASQGYVTDIVWGDVNLDGLLDLVVGVHSSLNQLYLFDEENPCPTLSEWLPVTGPPYDFAGNMPETEALLDPTASALQHAHIANTYSVALADVDNDGDLDLAVGNHSGAPDTVANRDLLYLNRNGMLDNFPAYAIGDDPRATRSVAWGDMDGDGDQDLAVGRWSGTKAVFENRDGLLLPEPVWESADSDLTRSVAWGDADGDGDLDLAATGLTLFTSGTANDIYYNHDGVLTTSSSWPIADSLNISNTNDVAWADMDGDGLLDLTFANQGGLISTHHGQRARPRTGLSNALRVVLYAPEGNQRRADSNPATLAPADFFAGVDVQSSDVITIPYWLVDPTERPAARIEVSYALSGTQWIPAVHISGTQVTDLATVASIRNASPHYFYWDTTNLSGKGFFGQSDTVVVRIRALPALATAPGDIAGTYQQGAVTTQTFPFRVAGNHSILVTDADGPVEGAMVMRKAKGAQEALLVESGAGETLLTGSDGILRGIGPLAVGDELIALAPVTNTHAFALYHTSGRPNRDTYLLQKVKEAGLQTLVVTETSPLVVYDLDISLEWDARNDPEFLNNFDIAIQRASDVFFDLTNGQALLGNVRLFHNRENWVFSDVVVYASNSIHPRASMGGVVLDAVDDIDKDGNVIESAYLPGQVHMGPFWDPFGQSQQELQQDWWRAFAHELGHYLLFLPDNYLGVEARGEVGRSNYTRHFKTTNCVGSFMTNAYDEKSYGEFLTANDANWQGKAGSECPDTVAMQLLTGRSDWETIESKLNWNMLGAQTGDGAGEDKPLIHAPTDEKSVNSGPNKNPLAITRVIPVQLVDHGDEARALIAPDYYDIRDQNNALVKVRQAQAYLYQIDRVAGSPDRIEGLIALGSTGRGADRIRVRGAEEGDRLCLYDSQSTPPRAGCVGAIDADTQSIKLAAVSDWSPDITVSPISSRTMSITVTQEITGIDVAKLDKVLANPAAEKLEPATIRALLGAMDMSELLVQAIPAYGPWQASHVVSATLPARLILQDYQIEDTEVVSDSLKTVTLTWSEVITIDYPSFEGFVRVWEPDPRDENGLALFPGTNLHESITQYYLSAGWGPNSRGANPANMRVWGPNSRGANPTNGRYWGPNSRGANPTNDRLWGPNSRGANPTNDRFWGPNSRGANPTNNRSWGPNSRGANPTNIRAWGSNNRTMEAPIASGDGRVTIFNVDDILSDPGATALQALSDAPSLDPWLTPVGKAYRFTTEAEASDDLRLTISFHYLTRDVPAGYEKELAVYHQPTDSDVWRRLPTDLYPDENMAAAIMPTRRQGTYALISTVELPPVQPGWNILAYTVPQERSVSSALASLTGEYSAVYGYDPQSEPAWSLFDPLVDAESAFSSPPSSLSTLEYGHGYIIHITATHPITPYLAVPEVSPSGASVAEQAPDRFDDDLTARASLANDLAIAPAVIAGTIAVNRQFADIAGKEIRAVIVDAEDGESRICGRGEIEKTSDGGEYYYALQVRSDSQEAGCGMSTSVVELRFGKDATLAAGLPWDNTELLIQPLVIP